ncbi:MAG: hypothetical protein AAGF77_12235, partial [Bacteroidota bacterium]
RRIYADYGKVPTGTLFGLSALREDAGMEQVAAWLGKAEETQPHHTHRNDHHHGHDHHHHDRQIVSASIEVDDPIPASVFDFWLDMLIAIKGPDLLRMVSLRWNLSNIWN